MIYPGYLLNPGDMFQVEAERVLFATGAPKDAQERRVGRKLRRKAKETKEDAVEASDTAQEEVGGEASRPVATPASVAELSEDSTTIEDVDAIKAKRKASKVDLKDLLDKAKSVLDDKKAGPSAKRKQELRAFTSSVRNAISQVNRKPVESLETTVSSLDDELNTLLSQLSISSPSTTPNPVSTETSSSPASQPTTLIISKEDREALRNALREARENPVDPTKPYATPWRPRPYMSAFAFIPRYLEVNQNICSAVYLRHPVVRPGLAEVPTPFAYDTSQLAFNWYLRRR